MKRLSTDSHQRLNLQQTVLLVAGLTSVLALVGWLVGGYDLMITTVSSILIIVMIAPYISPMLALRMHKAQQLSENDLPSIHALLNELTLKANLSHKPKLYYMPTRMMTAFTVGLKHNAAIALTDGLLRRMNRRELNAILAHEISHIKNQDMRIMAIADVINQMTWIISILGFLLILINLPFSIFTEFSVPWSLIVLFVILPIMTTLMKMKLSRTREFEADYSAAEITQDPSALISALSRLEYRELRWLTQFFWSPNKNTEPSQLRTHPDTDDRIDRLKAQMNEMPHLTQTFKIPGLDRIMPRHVWELNKRMLKNVRNPNSK